MSDPSAHPDRAVTTGAARRRWEGAILLTALAVYAASLGHGFVYDDGAAIVHNVHVHSLRRIPEMFASTEWQGSRLDNHLYRPLAALTYALNHAISGLAPWSYHLVNVLLHGLTSVLVFRLGLCWRLPIRAAGLGAVLFAVHPLHVEAVANVIGRKDMLPALFTLLMVLAHRRAVQRGGPTILLPILAYAAAMFSKEVGVTALGIVGLHDLLLWRGPAVADPPHRRRLAALYASYAVTAALYLWARWSVVGGLATPDIPFFDNPIAYAPADRRIPTAIGVIARGLWLQAWPVTLSPDYSFNAIRPASGLGDPWFLAGVAAIAVISVLAFVQRKRSKAPLLAGSFYALALLPATNLLVPVGTIFGERLLYFPSVATCLMLGALLSRLPALNTHDGRVCRGARRSAALVAPVLLALLAMRTVSYSLAWHDDLALFTVAVEAVPDSTRAHHKLGEALVLAGRPGDAFAPLERALAIAPSNYHSLYVLADAKLALGLDGEADALLKQAIEFNPGYPDALYLRGKIRLDRGQIAEAADYWRRALAIDPDHAGSNADYGNVLSAAGDHESARVAWERAVRVDPSKASAWFNLGVLYEGRGDRARARHAYQQFVEHGQQDFLEQVQGIRAKLERWE